MVRNDKSPFKEAWPLPHCLFRLRAPVSDLTGALDVFLMSSGGCSLALKCRRSETPLLRSAVDNMTEALTKRTNVHAHVVIILTGNEQRLRCVCCWSVPVRDRLYYMVVACSKERCESEYEILNAVHEMCLCHRNGCRAKWRTVDKRVKHVLK